MALSPDTIRQMEDTAKKLENWADQNKTLVRNFTASLTGPIPPIEFDDLIKNIKYQCSNVAIPTLIREYYDELISSAKECDNTTAGGDLETAKQLIGKIRYRAYRLVTTLKNTESDIKASQNDTCTHSADFSSVVWYGEQYTFNATQARCIEALWAEWKKGGLGLRELTLKGKIDSANDKYRLAHTFRSNNKMHPAWGVMIHSRGDGYHYLDKPKNLS